VGQENKDHATPVYQLQRHEIHVFSIAPTSTAIVRVPFIPPVKTPSIYPDSDAVAINVQGGEIPVVICGIF
jgi:hypothetical protein